MGFAERATIIRQIEELRGSRVVTYITSDRGAYAPQFSLPALSTQVSTEAQPFLYDQLRSLGRTDNLDLFLYTRGGLTDSVWPLVSIFREYGRKQFAVLVPFRAHSAGTLICLGADEIVMAEAAELSPIDPYTGNQFNPVDEIDKRTRRGISVEDVTSYMDLAKDSTKVGLADPNHILEIFKQLSAAVHPLALGNVNRVHSQIRILADKLLALHLTNETGEKDAVRIDHIVDLLTSSQYSHTHALNRKEAQALLGGDLVREASEGEQRLLWRLYEEYAQTMKLRETFCADNLTIASERTQELVVLGAFVETLERSFVFCSKCRIGVSSAIPPNVQVQIPPGQPMPLIPGLPVTFDVKVLSIGWEANEKGM